MTKVLFVVVMAMMVLTGCEMREEGNRYDRAANGVCTLSNARYPATYYRSVVVPEDNNQTYMLECHDNTPMTLFKLHEGYLYTSLTYGAPCTNDMMVEGSQVVIPCTEEIVYCFQSTNAAPCEEGLVEIDATPNR